MFAVGRGPQQAYFAAPADFFRVHIPHAGLEMLGVRMIGPVHQDCVWVMVYGNIHYPASRQLDTNRRPATSGETVHNNWFQEIDLTTALFEIRHSYSPFKNKIATSKRKMAIFKDFVDVPILGQRKTSFAAKNRYDYFFIVPLGISGVKYPLRVDGVHLKRCKLFTLPMTFLLLQIFLLI